MQTLQIDPEFQSLIPPLAEDERAELEASLKVEGCRHPLDVWHGVIVDGHNRYAICQANGIPFEVKEHEFEDRDAAKEWILRNQLARRNLEKYMRGALALRLKGVIAARAKANMSRGGQGYQKSDNPVHTLKELSAAADVSHDTIHKVEAVERDAPEPVKVAARAGDISTNRAYEITRALKDLPEADRARAAEICIDHDEKARTLVRLHKSQHTDPDSNGTYEEILRTGGFHYGDELEKWCDFKTAGVGEINEALRSLAKHHKIEALRFKRESAPPLPEGKYNLILSDPPWRYEHVKTESRAIENHYPTMTLEDICALPVAELADDDAVLFLWATSPKLAEAMQVIEAWGFEYRTCMVWVKDKIGMGHYARQRHELLLIARRGSPGVPLPADREDSVIEAPRGQHSEKPLAAYEAIERMYPFATKVEIFARNTRDGWSSWGNEVDATQAA